MKNILLLTGLLLATGLVAQAQPSTGGPTPGPTQPPTETPLDGGASLLLAGGVAYGLRRLRRLRQRQRQRVA